MLSPKHPLVTALEMRSVCDPNTPNPPVVVDIAWSYRAQPEPALPVALHPSCPFGDPVLYVGLSKLILTLSASTTAYDAPSTASPIATLAIPPKVFCIEIK